MVVIKTQIGGQIDNSEGGFWDISFDYLRVDHDGEKVGLHFEITDKKSANYMSAIMSNEDAEALINLLKDAIRKNNYPLTRAAQG